MRINPLDAPTVHFRSIATTTTTTSIQFFTRPQMKKGWYTSLQQKRKNPPPHFRALPKLELHTKFPKRQGSNPKVRKRDAFCNTKFPNIPKIWLCAKLNLTLDIDCQLFWNCFWAWRHCDEICDTPFQPHWLWSANRCHRMENKTHPVT